MRCTNLHAETARWEARSPVQEEVDSFYCFASSSTNKTCGKPWWGWAPGKWDLILTSRAFRSLRMIRSSTVMRTAACAGPSRRLRTRELPNDMYQCEVSHET